MAIKPSEDLTHFKADHPFLFFILNQQTSQIIFMGRYGNSAEEITPYHFINIILLAYALRPAGARLTLGE